MLSIQAIWKTMDQECMVWLRIFAFRPINVAALEAMQSHIMYQVKKTNGLSIQLWKDVFPSISSTLSPPAIPTIFFTLCLHPRNRMRVKILDFYGNETMILSTFTARRFLQKADNQQLMHQYGESNSFLLESHKLSYYDYKHESLTFILPCYYILNSIHIFSLTHFYTNH